MYATETVERLEVLSTYNEDQQDAIAAFVAYGHVHRTTEGQILGYCLISDNAEFARKFSNQFKLFTSLGVPEYSEYYGSKKVVICAVEPEHINWVSQDHNYKTQRTETRQFFASTVTVLDVVPFSELDL